eukprot:CAMPEP_0195635570 /NCGR_PEP_ID=MMETSP0815-20121206/23352_1 /TAXON_ID=97485 /ORGANISM="Prymnesium parvum, Strain Texoma1" /LENGTH=202 /DNA_ID=CAMNT_0040777513 /DNA_START=110 /DNA_END=715 /DNA_ORIENTATION=-
MRTPHALGTYESRKPELDIMDTRATFPYRSHPSPARLVAASRALKRGLMSATSPPALSRPTTRGLRCPPRTWRRRTPLQLRDPPRRLGAHRRATVAADARGGDDDGADAQRFGEGARARVERGGRRAQPRGELIAEPGGLLRRAREAVRVGVERGAYAGYRVARGESLRRERAIGSRHALRSAARAVLHRLPHARAVLRLLE